MLNTGFETVWQNILAHEGETFYTVKHLPFTYRVRGDNIVPDRAHATLSKGNFEKAYLNIENWSPTVFGKKIIGPSYVKAILQDSRIVPTDYDVRAAERGKGDNSMIDWNGNGRLDPIDIGIATAIEPQTEDADIVLSGYPFHLVQKLAPERTLLGKIKQFDPKERYRDKDVTPLNKYGSGPFCRFSIKKRGYAGVCGVYALLDDTGVLYIGQTENLAQRFNTGYGTIAPRNCYVGGQNTNCKINSMVLAKYLGGEQVYLYFYETADYDRVEHALISALRPPYNG